MTGLDYYRNYVANMQKVTRADLANYVRKYIIGKPHVTALLLSPADRTKLGVTPALLMDMEAHNEKDLRRRAFDRIHAAAPMAQAQVTKFDVAGIPVILKPITANDVIA